MAEVLLDDLIDGWVDETKEKGIGSDFRSFVDKRFEVSSMSSSTISHIFIRFCIYIFINYYL